MREVRSIERLRSAVELLYTGLLALCLALPLPFIAAVRPQTQTLLWCLGAAFGTVLLQLLFRLLPKKLLPSLLCVPLTALALLLCPDLFLRLSYGLCLGVQLLICAVLPRPEGKFVLSVPKIYHAPIPLVIYALSQILKSAVLTATAVTLSSLFVVLLLLHWQAGRLLYALRDRASTAVSDRGIVRLNRQLMALFCVLGAVFVVLTPMLLRFTPGAPQETGVYEYQPVTEPPLQETLPPDVEFTPPPGTTYSYTLLEQLTVGFVVLLSLGAVGMLVYAIVRLLRNLRGGTDRHSDPHVDDEVTVEALPDSQQSVARQQSAADGGSWARRIRRQYQRLIHTRAAKGSRLDVLTPAELEQAARLDGASARTLHALYEKARYSAALCTRQDYLAAKTAAQQLKKETPSHD